ncbi:PREDICTED: uncharacterized protein LOC108364457 [Rhagoletis zephyria]|uniref:uncharacterized protein LOC108364457 n=1 Tax=Rhagoletis zephyria TaxID=28612 RepID=UPI0008117C97|nr:PREDICTED: uncharacterized protein LOC108364457 [Rhagoletis zephyria]XP_036338245.1 uncharacterized protein LOC118748059 [Rhagoletis pomonella]
MSEVGELSKEFDCLLQELECVVQRLNFREKSIATEWIRKLKKENSSLEDLKLRLDFMDYFVNCWKCGIFSSEPFNKVPQPNVPLQKLRYLLPADHKIRSIDETSDEQRKLYVEEMFEMMPDRGAFLSDQPVPLDGTFFLVLINQK